MASSLLRDRGIGLSTDSARRVALDFSGLKQEPKRYLDQIISEQLHPHD